jgi:hypothetical protein
MEEENVEMEKNQKVKITVARVSYDNTFLVLTSASLRPLTPSRSLTVAVRIDVSTF